MAEHINIMTVNCAPEFTTHQHQYFTLRSSAVQCSPSAAGILWSFQCRMSNDGCKTCSLFSQALLENSRREKGRAEAAARNGKGEPEFFGHAGSITDAHLQGLLPGVRLHVPCTCSHGRLHVMFQSLHAPG